MQKPPVEDRDKLVELDKVSSHVDGMLVCEIGLDGETLQVNDYATKSEILYVSMADISRLF